MAIGITGSWDGYHERWGGPDRWLFGLADQPPLFDAVFSTVPGKNYMQSYPGRHPNDRFRSHTGSAERRSLGYSLANFKLNFFLLPLL